MNHHGRIKITTDVPEITYENVIDVLRRAFSKHQLNVGDIEYLIDYEAGEQPLIREKQYRKEIDIYSQDNLAHYIVERHLGFDWASPITVVQRGEKDSGRTDEAYEISLFNEQNDLNGEKIKRQELGRYVEITGIGFTYDEPVKKDDFEDSFFSTSILHPSYAFVVYSSYHIDGRPMMAVTFRHDQETGNNYFTCFTKTRRFEILNLEKIINGDLIEDVPEEKRWIHNSRSGVKNILGKIPIIEYIRSHDRTGAFEHQIPALDQLNLLLSDYSNSIEQNLQSVWHANDVEFEKDEDGNVKKPKSNEWLLTYTPQDGKTPIVEALTINADYTGQLSNISSLRSRILEECNIPNRDTTSGGSTGVAADTITGYDAFEEAAQKKQQIIEDCRMKELDVQLACIRNSLVIDENHPLLGLKTRDCKVSIKRPKNYELTTKINFFATAVSHGINGLHALSAANIFGDPNQVWEDSKERIEQYQDSVFSQQNQSEGGEGEQPPNKDRLEQDLSDQITNSPAIDGMSTGQEV